MSSKTVYVVTGAYRGIGLEIVRQLCEKVGSSSTVYLTARDETRATGALEQLKKEGYTPSFAALDITDSKSIETFKQTIKSQSGHINVLINNAGFAYEKADTTPYAEQAEATVGVNYTGTVKFIRAVEDLIPENGRVINVASRVGELSQVSGELQAAFSNAKTVEEVDKLMQQFVDAAKAGTQEDQGFSKTIYGTYGMSKLGLIAVTNVFARLWATKSVYSMSMCPGWCKSDMAGWEKPPKTAAEGAETVVWLALHDNPKSLTGKFFAELEEVKW
jgi:carbonyl reductase 1/polyribonucleotide 5'-hydroxyl-kinase